MERNESIRAVFAICLLSLTLPSASPARTLYVDDDGPADFETIQAAIDAAADGDTILVRPGTYTGDGNRDIDFRGKAIIVKSEQGPRTCIVDCNGSEAEPHRGFVLPGNAEYSSLSRPGPAVEVRNEMSAATIDGFTIINGNVPGQGGGVLCGGGGIIKDCIIMNNVAGDGGGIFIGDGAVVNCVITRNVARGGGGGAHASMGLPTFANCTIAANRGWAGGGGILLGHGGTASLVNCIIARNRAVSGNQIRRPGGTVVHAPMGLKAVNCCIESEVRSDLFGPLPEPWLGRSGVATEDVIYEDPCFVDMQRADFRLRPESPCVDGGAIVASVELPGTDIDGNPRISDADRDGIALPDIGAYEVPAPDQPYIWVSKAHLEFAAPAGSSDPEVQSFTVGNLGSQGLHWTIQTDCNWLHVSPEKGTSGPTPVEVILRASGSPPGPGKFTCNLAVSDERALNNPQTVPITFYSTRILHVPEEVSTIQAAINAANPYDTILVADGIHEGAGYQGINFLGKPITVRSESGPKNCVIDCGLATDGIVFLQGEDEHSILDGFTIVAYRKAICCHGASPTIRNCRIEGDIIAIDSSWADPRIENCVFTGCRYALQCEGSNPFLSGCSIRNCEMGLWCYGGGTVELSNCDITHCRQEALSLWNCLGVEIRQCELTGNGMDSSKPALRSIASHMVIDRCTISGNYAGLSFETDSRAVLRNCIICGNGRPNDVSVYGVHADRSDLLIDNCTVVANRGLSCNRPFVSDPTVRIISGIFWGNGTDRITGVADAVIMTYSDVQGGWLGEGNIDADPLFLDEGHWASGKLDDPNDDFWVEGDYHLKSQAGRWDAAGESWVIDELTSPCVDAGDPNTPVGDEPEPNGGRINMGAYGGTAEASKSYIVP